MICSAIETRNQERDMKKIWNSLARDLWIVLLDIVAVNAAYILALLIRFFVNGQFRTTVSYLIGDWARFTPFYTILALLIFILFRLYGGMWRYAGVNDMNRIIGASVSTAVIHVLGTLIFIRRMPISYYVIGAMLQFVFLVVIRFSYRILLVEKKKVAGRNIPAVPTMIIGAGDTARKTIRHLEDTPFRPVVLVDGQSAGKTLDGIEVVSDFNTDLNKVKAVFIADPNISEQTRKEIKAACEEQNIELQDYTGILTNLGGKVPVASLLELAGGPVTLVIDGQETKYANGEEALQSLNGRYDIEQISNPVITLKKPDSTAAYIGYEAWAKEHKESTGEDVSFF